MTADVTVLGGGIVGVLTAYRLAASGKSVVLLEKNRIATSETGYSTAFITRVPDVPSIAKFVEQHGEQIVKDLFVENGKAQEYLFSLVEQKRIACGFARCPSYYFSYDGNTAALKNDAAALTKIEPETELVTLEAHAAFSAAHEAIRFQNEGRFDVRKFLLGLLQQNGMERLRVFEDSEATNIEISDNTRVTTKNGTVESTYLIDATGIPHEMFPELRSLVKPVTTYAIVAQYGQKPALADALYWDTEHPYHYLRRIGESSVMIGGEDHDAGKGNAQQAHAALERYCDEKIPGKSAITHAWAGTLYETIDGLPYCAEHPAYRGKVAFVTGLAGNGIVMGALAGTIAASLAIGTPHPVTELFSLRRSGMTLPVTERETLPSVEFKKTTNAERNEVRAGKNTAQRVRFAIPLFLFFLFLVPGYSFFHLRGGWSFLSGLELPALSHALFPLVGLYAFFFVWSQVIIGANRDWLKQYFPGIMRFHRVEGVFALLFACLHPVLLLIGVGLAAYFAKTYIPQSLHFYIWLGYLQLTLIVMTAGTALLMRLSFIRKIWRWIHYANYLVFVSVWIHSWFLGSDAQKTNLRYLWYFYGGTFIVTVLARVLRNWKKRDHHKSMRTDASEGFTSVGAASSFTQGRPHCVAVKGKKIILVNVSGQFYALDNTCSHAGGPLCEGTVEDSATIVCPWHASRFDMKTGAVVSGVARRPQTCFDVNVVNGDVLVRVPPAQHQPY